ncbi:uncharacterized protein LOC110176038 [Drosophila serrata]|uniref:uncharacterized protein LOC110176038 n=1 Tax=Drosophila serrata TaxID=7274 RepID=UPI000A1D2343|nr:uncharacterized protein LOC110176038 [Drosophila serrata]
MENFPIANSFIRNSYIQNVKIRALLPQFEEALGCNQQVRQKLRAIQPELQALEFHSAVCDQVITVAVAAQNTATMASKSVATCYKQIVHMEQLINEMEIGNIVNYTVKCKEDETIREITLLKHSFDEEAKQLDVLEARSVVRNLRQLQIHQESSQNDLAVLEREVYKLERQMLNKMKNATDYRNKKIIHILEIRKLILANEAKSTDLAGIQPNLDLKRKKRPSISPKGWVNGSILLPALDFLSKFMQFKTNDEEKPQQENESESVQEVALQSILHRRNGTPSPTKQVRFVASPDLESVHIVNRLSSMSTDDGSVGREDLKPDSSKKSSQMGGLTEERDDGEDWNDGGCEDHGQEVEYESEEIKYLSAEDEELTLMESDGEESSGDENLTPGGTKKKGSTQFKKIPQMEEPERENESRASWGKGYIKESQNKSINKQKVEVLSVVIIPPPGDTTQSTSTPQDSGSKNNRFKLTASQKTSSDAMDVDEDDRLPLQFQQKAEDEDENNIEFPMAQPTPIQFKNPSSMAVSPPSSDQADSMLNFSEPNCEYNDDFWLSNTDNNSNVDQFYDL